MSYLSSSPPRTSSPPPLGADVDVDMNDSAPVTASVSQSRHSSLAPRSPNVRAGLRQVRPQRILPSATEEHGARGAPSDISEMGGTIWGTTINVDSAKLKLRKFISEFANANGERVYPALIEECIESETMNLNLDLQNLNEYNADLYRQIIRYPAEMLPVCDAALNEYADKHFAEMLAESYVDNDLWTRPFNMLEVKSMRNMDPTDIDSLVSIRGMVIRTTNTIPDIQTAFFRCCRCHHETEVLIELGRIPEPTVCPNQQCQWKQSMQLIHNRCKFQDKQLVKVQETPECIPDGETPQTIDVYCYDSLLDICRPGDRVEITGVYRASAIRSNPRRRTVESVYKTYIDSVHVKKSKATQFSLEDSKAGEESDYYTSFDETDEFAETRAAREQKFKEMAQDPQIYDRLAASLAPSIWEMDDVKKGILAQLFGATDKDFTGHGGGRFRSQLNILLCGDPGTSKSQLLQYVHKVVPRGIYTSGKGSSAVGLTAYITKDPDSGDLVLESGALVLSDRGVCCIDEFDKMSESARSILHEVMEQQTVSIAKAGIICTLNARTSILAAANPIESRYNPTKSVVENIDLPPTLMSRFDLIYLVLDRPNEMLDRKLAKHIVSLYYAKRDKQDTLSLLDHKTLMEYISYSRREIQPTLSDDACTRLIDGYVDMRSMGRLGGRKVITATPRQLESLIRISEALARMQHSKEVLEEHVEEAIRLHKVATLAAATDPRTGAIDLDSLNVGRSAEEGRALMDKAARVLEALRTYRRTNIRLSKLMLRYNNEIDDESQKTTVGDMKKIIEHLEEAHKLRPGNWLDDDPMIQILDKSDL